MKPLYPFVRVMLPFILAFLSYGSAVAQCPDGSPNGGTAFDTTINTPAGVTSRVVKFPKFNPVNGMVTCVRLCVAITGIVDTMSVENTSASPQTADVFYTRNDNITGPGLISPLTNSLMHQYGTYNLDASDGNLGSGPDFVSVSHDTLLNAVTVCRTISDSATLAQFYGIGDSVAYTYNITALVSPTSSGNYNFRVGTSAFVNFRFEYCTCPSTVLPLNVNSFSVLKLTDKKAELKWTGTDDAFSDYYYETEVSRDSRNFSSIGITQKNISGDTYKSLYTVPNGESGVFYFRVKQVYANGYVRYSIIKQVVLESSVPVKFSIFPNPSTGIVGIKFDNNSEGQYHIQIYNTQGQLLVQKELVVRGSTQAQVATLKSGVYWVRLTDLKSQASSVNQLLIK